MFSESLYAQENTEWGVVESLFWGIYTIASEHVYGRGKEARYRKLRRRERGKKRDENETGL